MDGLYGVIRRFNSTELTVQRSDHLHRTDGSKVEYVEVFVRLSGDERLLTVLSVHTCLLVARKPAVQASTTNLNVVRILDNKRPRLSAASRLSSTGRIKIWIDREQVQCVVEGSRSLRSGRVVWTLSLNLEHCEYLVSSEALARNIPSPKRCHSLHPSCTDRAHYVRKLCHSTKMGLLDFR